MKKTLIFLSVFIIVSQSFAVKPGATKGFGGSSNSSWGSRGAMGTGVGFGTVRSTSLSSSSNPVVQNFTPPSSTSANAITTKAPRTPNLKNANLTGTNTSGGVTFSGRYSHLSAKRSAGDGKSFTYSQRKAILSENASQNGWRTKSDKSGKPVSGVNAQIDHFQPKSKGGPNVPGNASVLSGKENRVKSNKVPPTIITKLNSLDRRR